MKNIIGDNAYNRFMTRLFDVTEVSALALLCCIPVLTAGAALTAACAVFMKMGKDQEGQVYKEYFRQFLSNLKESMAGWIINMVITGIVLFDLYYARDNALQYGITLPLAIGDFAYLCWYFCIRARFRESTCSAIRNTMKFSVAFLPVSLLCGCIPVGILLLLNYYPVILIILPVFFVAALWYLPSVLIGRTLDAWMLSRE